MHIYEYGFNKNTFFRSPTPRRGVGSGEISSFLSGFILFFILQIATATFQTKPYSKGGPGNTCCPHLQLRLELPAILWSDDLCFLNKENVR